MPVSCRRFVTLYTKFSYRLTPEKDMDVLTLKFGLSSLVAWKDTRPRTRNRRSLVIEAL